MTPAERDALHDMLSCKAYKFLSPVFWPEERSDMWGTHYKRLLARKIICSLSGFLEDTEEEVSIHKAALEKDIDKMLEHFERRYGDDE